MNKLIIVAGTGVIALTTAGMLTNGFGEFEPHTAPMPESIQLIASKKMQRA